MTLKEAVKFSGMTIKEIEEETGIPYRSLQNWISGVRQPPDYVEEYLIQKLMQTQLVVRVKTSVSAIRIEVMTEEGFELDTEYPVKDGLMSIEALYKIGTYIEAGYKIIFI